MQNMSVIEIMDSYQFHTFFKLRENRDEQERERERDEEFYSMKGRSMFFSPVPT